MRIIDQKYKTSGDITKLDGTPVPEDEPLILFRAKDALLPELLEVYKDLCQKAGSPPHQLELVEKRLGEIRDWQTLHSDRVRRPD